MRAKIFYTNGRQKNYVTGVRALRKKMGLNTVEFGKRVGVSGRTVEDWEQGRRNPSGPALKMMESILKTAKS